MSLKACKELATLFFLLFRCIIIVLSLSGGKSCFIPKIWVSSLNPWPRKFASSNPLSQLQVLRFELRCEQRILGALSLSSDFELITLELSHNVVGRCPVTAFLKCKTYFKLLWLKLGLILNSIEAARRMRKTRTFNAFPKSNSWSKTPFFFWGINVCLLVVDFKCNSKKRSPLPHIKEVHFFNTHHNGEGIRYLR